MSELEPPVENNAELTAEPAGAAPAAEGADPIEPAVEPADAGEVAEAEAEAGEEFRLPPLADSTTTQQDFEVFVARKTKDLGPEDVLLVLPADKRDRVIAMSQGAANINYEKTDAGQEMMFYLREGERARPTSGAFESSVDREGSAWRQGVKGERGLLTAMRPSFDDDEAEVVSGEKAVLRMRALLGQGGLITVPLWHSGFWITLKAPSDEALLELERMIADEKVILGRATNGMVFSNTGAFISSHLVRFAMEHYYSTSLKSKDDIANRIAIQDIQHLAWALACATYPAGFAFSREVLGETVEQNKTIEGHIHLAKLQFTDTAALTERQIAHMSRRSAGSMTNESVDAYREQFLRGQDREVEINENVKIVFSVPSIADHVDAGQRWVNGIVTMCDKAFGLDQDLQVRNSYILDQGRATLMRQYSHWVKEIHMRKKVVKDRTTIEETLAAMTASEDARNKFYEAVIKFVDDSMVSVIAVPTATAKEENQLPRFPHLVPIDAMSAFFILLGQKVEAIRNR